MISSSVGVLWCVLLMHWFSDLGSRQARRPPLAFLLKASALTQSVGSVMEVITPRSSIFSSSVLILLQELDGVFSWGLYHWLGVFPESDVKLSFEVPDSVESVWI